MLLLLSVSLWSNLEKIFYFRIFLCRNMSVTKTTDFSSFLLKTTGAHYFSQPLYHGCCLQRTELRASKEALLLLFTSHLTQENFVSLSSLSAFCHSFGFFVFVSQPIETNIANLQGLIHSNFSKTTNQVTFNMCVYTIQRKIPLIIII